MQMPPETPSRPESGCSHQAELRLLALTATNRAQAHWEHNLSGREPLAQRMHLTPRTPVAVARIADTIKNSPVKVSLLASAHTGSTCGF